MNKDKEKKIMVRMGKVILTSQIYEEKKITRRRRDKNKHTNYHDKEKQGNQYKENTIWKRRI